MLVVSSPSSKGIVDQLTMDQMTCIHVPTSVADVGIVDTRSMYVCTVGCYLVQRAHVKDFKYLSGLMAMQLCYYSYKSPDTCSLRCNYDLVHFARMSFSKSLPK